MSSNLVFFVTPKKIQLQGVWLGAKNPEQVFIFIHGLGGNLFSRSELTSLLASGKSAVLVFNNRGSGTINYWKRGSKTSSSYFLAGVAHEIFSDCVDDLDGAVDYVVARGVKKIFLLGHSTGCHKSIFYLAKRPYSLVSGAVLLAPVSDYAGLSRMVTKRSYRQALMAARRLVRLGQSQALLPAGLWPSPLSAQRFLSLYTPESQEEIFSYASDKLPTMLRRVKKPLLAFFAEMDQFGDRPAEDLADWFQKQRRGRKQSQVAVIAGAEHGFGGYETILATHINSWVKKIGRPRKK